jgi:phosphotriesterase-related protein
MSLNHGKVETVTGPVDPESLGVTLVHEHLTHKATSKLFTPRKPDPKYAELSSKPFAFQNLWWINFHPYSCLDNLVVDDDETVKATKREMTFFKENGGGSIVECTTFGRNLDFMKELAMSSGVKVIAGSGYYVNMSQDQLTHNFSVETIYDELKQDMLVGTNGIRCGILGELGTCYPLHPFERKVLNAAATLQSEFPTIPVSIHPGRDKRAPDEVLNVFLEAGGKADKTAMCHLDRTFLRKEDLLSFAGKTSCFLEFDLFGTETSYYEASDELDMPSDAVRIERIKELVDEGHEDRILISHDIHTKHRLMDFGGHGFSHIILNTIPKMRMRGFSEETIKNVTVKNPKTWLTL